MGIVACSAGSEGWSDEDVESAFAADLVDDRPAVAAAMGRPDTFVISWLDVDGHLVQMESWGYHTFETRVDFVDGEAVLTTDLPSPEPDTIYSGWYEPAAFTTLMPMNDALAVAKEASPAGVDPEFVDLSDGGEDTERLDLYVGDQVMLGFVDDQLVYVETMALEPERVP